MKHTGAKAIPFIARGPVPAFDKVVDNVSFSFGCLILFVEGLGLENKVKVVDDWADRVTW